MNLELIKGSKWHAKWQHLVRQLSLSLGGNVAEGALLAPSRVTGREWKVALMAQVMVLGLWFIDYKIDIHYHFAILYFIPITFAGLVGGVAAGLVTSATCTAAWFLAEVLSGADYGAGGILYYKNFFRLLSFSIISFLLARSRELNQQLTEKAQGLSQEVELRKRTEKIDADEKQILEKVACDQALPDILEALARKIEEWHEGLVCSVFLFDSERNRFLSAIAPNFPTDLQKAFYRRPLEQLTCESEQGHANGDKLNFEVATSPNWKAFRDLTAEFGLHTQASKPVLSPAGELVGILCLFSRQGSGGAELDIALVEKARDIASIAIERSRLSSELRKLSELIIEAQEAERRRIARELHDSVNQMLSSVIFRFGMIEGQILDTNQELKEELSRAKDLLTRGLDEIHRISDALRPSELDALGLVPSIRSLCEEFQTKARLDLKFESKLGLKRLDDHMELTLYRIIQEALTNIEKHAAATRAVVRLTSDGGEIQLRIWDNGKGLESTAMRLKSSKKVGMGLLNMRERTAFLGGVFSIQSKEGAGTEICVRIPLDASGKQEERET